MNGNVNTGNVSVDALAEMNISGNVTPANWYKTILRDNGKPSASVRNARTGFIRTT